MFLGLLRGTRPILAVVLGMAACILVLGPLALGGTTGKISGVVTDDATGQPIAGAVVRVAGTPLSAVTDAEGRYTILNVPVGKHTLVASMLGEEESPAETELLLFQAIEVQDLKVSVDLDTQTDITLSSKPVEMGTIVVIAERPVVIPDRTASLRIVESEQIQSLPTRGYRDIVALQPGVVVRTGNLLNVRGGRTSEVAYFVDGFSQQDPLTGVSTTQINNNDLEEVSVVTGGFNAEYGWIASGAVNVTTKGGTDQLSGTFEAVTDNFHGANYDYNVYNGSLAGPLTGISDDIKFIVSAERRYRGDRTPSTVGGDVPDDHESGWTLRGKTSWRLSSSSELRLGGLASIDRWDVFLNAWRYNAEHAPRLEDKNQSLYATFERILSPKTFYTLSTNYFMTERERGDGVYFDNIWGYGRPGVSSSYDETDLFYSWDDINGPTETEDTVINGRTYTVRGDEGAVWNNYLHRRSSYVGAKFDITSQVTQFHELKSGVEFQRHTLRRYQHLWPTRVWMEGNGGFTDVDRYGYNESGESEEDDGLQGAKHPITMAAYLQDKFELEGMVINAGLRLDYFDVNTKRLRSEENPLDPDGYGDNPAATPEQRQLAQELDDNDLEDSRPETALSPRLGLAFPVADGSVFHAAYGRFMQRPDLQNLYVSYDFLEYKIKNGGYFFPFGNPNLRPERTIAYEVGWTRQLGASTSFDLTAYYKDVKDLTQVVNQPATPFSFSTYRNADYGTIKGVELRFDMRRMRNVGLQASYALSSATGTGSDANSQSNIAWMAGETPLTPSPLDHDQRHKFVGIFDLQYGPKEGPSLGTWHPFANTGLNVTFQAGSGFPYTPTEVWNEVTLASNRGPLEGAVNSRYSGWRMQTDLKATKSFWVAGTQMEFSLWIINLFNTENVIGVFQSTGLANSTGWLETAEGQAFRDAYDEAHDSSGLTGEQKYRLRESDPNNYDVPRQIRAGLKVSF